MRASRLVELLLRLQLAGAASASELAEALGVSVRTIYRDIDALAAAGVPLSTTVGRNGGIRLDPGYRVGGLPHLAADEARGLLFAIVPAIAAQLGFDPTATDRSLLPAMERSAEAAARLVRDRLLVEPTHWFVPPDDSPVLADVAKAVWDARLLRMTYRGTDVVVRPLGLVLKGSTWYVLAEPSRGRHGEQRLFRLSRAEAAEALGHRFERPAGFDLAAAWSARRAAFMETLPECVVDVRVAPTAERLLASLDEGAPTLPLPDDVARDGQGWARLRLRFERSPEGAARHLLRLGADVEVLGPPEVRALMARTASGLASLYPASPPATGRARRAGRAPRRGGSRDREDRIRHGVGPVDRADE